MCVNNWCYFDHNINGDIMEKISDLNEKSEYKKVMEDYSNNYGFNTGLNSFRGICKSDEMETIVKGNKQLKKR